MAEYSYFLNRPMPVRRAASACPWQLPIVSSYHTLTVREQGGVQRAIDLRHVVIARDATCLVVVWSKSCGILQDRLYSDSTLAAKRFPAKNSRQCVSSTRHNCGACGRRCLMSSFGGRQANSSQSSVHAALRSTPVPGDEYKDKYRNEHRCGCVTYTTGTLALVP